MVGESHRRMKGNIIEGKDKVGVLILHRRAPMKDTGRMISVRGWEPRSTETRQFDKSQIM